jgi:uncharacterized protein YktB (UPF0637 family)
MPAAAFNASDFKAFETKGFQPRMAVIRTRIRPKLEAIGHSLVPGVSRATGAPSYAHVARHLRRTVNPPDDTWVALGPEARGYKKAGHFKVAVSRHCVRFLFEVGPEHADKKRWASAWKKSALRLGRCSAGCAGFRGSRTSTTRSQPRRCPTSGPRTWPGSPTRSCARATASWSSDGR